MLKTTSSGKPTLSLLLCLIGLLSFSAPKARAGQAEQAPPAPPVDQVSQPNQADSADPSAQSDANDPPTRVARISYVDGSVSLQAGGQGDWGNAARNRPMTIGDKIWTDKDSRAELQTGVVSIHLGSMTALSFLNLDQNITQMRLAEGSINFRVKEIREGDTYEVDTPNLAFTIKQAGAFRIDVSENGDNTGITVIRGAGQVTASGKTYDLQPGQRGIFNGTDDVQSTIAPQAPPADGLDKWANDRDLGEQNSVSKRYVPEDMPGTQDLDNNGTWSEDGANGPIWYPSEVSPGWAPYSNGYWSYVGPWGWTWVDYAPWGFAPFHYGRWGYIGGRWGWYPGPRVGFSIYGPAFVGFLGGGFGFGFGVGFGVGWFPLGYGEPFHPWYHGGYGYVNRINVRNTYIHNTNVFHSNSNFNYAYAHNTHAVTAASRSAFTGGQAINRGAANINEASLRGAQVTNSAGVSPSRQSALGAANARGNVSRPPSSVENRSVMARTAPAAGASHIPVRTMNTSGLSAGRPGNAGTSARQNQLSQSRPPSAVGNSSRSWSAQGNTTDHGQAPNGFGSSNNHSPSNNSTMSARANNRPPWAGSGATANGGANAGGRSYTPQGNAPSNNHNYSAPSRSNPAPTRTYSAPSRSYGGGSAPHSSGGGSAPHSGGGGATHGGGGGSHGHR
jgi:FecR protein